VGSDIRNYWIKMAEKNNKKIPVEVYSRVVGYFRPINQWNNGKQEEFRKRKFCKILEEKIFKEEE
jgi:anaerobic ribonucleoside-triphosphate reductase